MPMPATDPLCLEDGGRILLEDGALLLGEASTGDTLEPDLYTNTQTFYDITAQSIYTLTPALYTNTQTFYGPSAAASYTLLPSLYTNDQVFYTATVIPGAVVVEPSLYTNTQTFYAVSAAASNTIAPDLYVNQQTFYSAVIEGGEGSQIKLYYNIGMFGIGPLNG